MKKSELQEHFERMKDEILNKLQRTKEKWQKVWLEAQGNPDAENELIHLKLEIQMREAKAREELKEMEEKVKRAGEDDPAPESPVQ